MVHDVIVIGGGLAGLACALRLQQQGIEALVLEGADRVGGRVCTDRVEGFALDRGFQVYLTAYPEGRRVLDLDALWLRPFYPGALVRRRGRFHKVADPWRHPLDALVSLASPVGTLGDKLRVRTLRARARGGTVEERLSAPQTTTLAALRRDGFSEGMIDAFFRPFLGGVFLERELETSSRMLEFVFRMFSAGDAALPAAGMQAIPEQLSLRLPAGAVRTETVVTGVDREGVTLAGGKRLPARAVVIATEGPEAARLAAADRERAGGAVPGAARGTTCLYFAASQPPVTEPILVLAGDGPADGPVNNLCVPSLVQPAYAPPGAALVSVTIVGVPALGDAALLAAVLDQLTDWFGAAVRGWRHLRTYRIPYALPSATPAELDPSSRAVRLREGLYVAGDHRESPSTQGALVSGRRAAEALIAESERRGTIA
ncbi:MAG: FAD-dependent oxidoreductase [Acidobacteria bacterium]|nr:FAD-dependent oxidoreductase [Acidobacteriota bacterium]